MKNRSQHSDEALLKLVAADDEKAFEQLFDRYWEKAHCIASSKLQSPEAAHEIVNDLFISFWQRRHSLAIKNFSHYLHVSLKYKIITAIAREISERTSVEEFRRQMAVAEEQTALVVEYNDFAKALEESVKTLPEKTQAVFRLNRLEGRSVSEIASELNLSEKAIEYHITRSRKELRLLLKDFLVLAWMTASCLS